MSFTETELGYTLEKDGFLLFFGNNKATLEHIKNAYPQISFRSVHQKHTDLCISSFAHSEETIADAHFTDKAGVGLVIKTADCLPILGFSKNDNLILAIHAGWRGVENEITKKSIGLTHAQEIDIFIGPHILQKSFEVDFDVKEQLEKVYLKYSENFDSSVFVEKEKKFCLDLATIVDQQIKSLKIDYKMRTLKIDTVTDRRFHSYRRDKDASGRNLSFIARLKS